MPPDEQTVLHLHRRREDVEVQTGVEKKEITAAVEIKDAERGLVEAVFATLLVVDKDRDVIMPGAIEEGAVLAISDYGHSVVFGDKPVGKGAAHVADNKALVQGRYFLNTSNGLDSFNTVKEMGRDQQWSFGFKVLESEEPSEEWKKRGARRILTKLDCFEVSPVMIGAGVGTMTLATKELDEEALAVGATEAEVEQARKDAEALEAKRLADEVALKEATARVMAEFERTQRTLRRMNVA